MIETGDTSIVYEAVKPTKFFRHALCGCVNGSVIGDIDSKCFYRACNLIMSKGIDGFLPFLKITATEKNVVRVIPFMQEKIFRRFVANALIGT